MRRLLAILTILYGLGVPIFCFFGMAKKYGLHFPTGLNLLAFGNVIAMLLIIIAILADIFLEVFIRPKNTVR